MCTASVGSAPDVPSPQPSHATVPQPGLRSDVCVLERPDRWPCQGEVNASTPAVLASHALFSLQCPCGCEICAGCFSEWHAPVSCEVGLKGSAGLAHFERVVTDAGAGTWFLWPSVGSAASRLVLQRKPCSRRSFHRDPTFVWIFLRRSSTATCVSARTAITSRNGLRAIAT